MLKFHAPWTVVRTAAGALIFALALAVHAPARADEVQDAAKLLKAGQHAQALERVNRVLAQKPRDPQARFLRGLILTEQGNTREAIDVFTKLTQDYPELPEPYNNLAVIYAAQGQYEKARMSLEQSIRTHPSYATAYENLGDVYAKLASQAYDKALQLDSSNAGAQNKLSLVRELVGGPVTVAKAPAPVAQKPAPEKPAAEKTPPIVLAQKASPPAEKPAAEKPVAEKPVAEKPAPKAAQTPAASEPAEITKTLNAWAQAWSNKNADAYLAFYSRDFKTPGGEARAAWEKSRRERIAAPKSIAVAIASPKVTMSGSNQAKVTFRQSYRSDKLKTNSTKTLVMVKSDGRWLIQQERSGS
ncbi:MAG TPA: tetratricopeptide repeat protein [Burkholderiales bacterium]|nr:tetratricopeptide repeat protein [Burkholderiales bacterium]